jgi:lipoprotein-releasing system permease protein
VKLELFLARKYMSSAGGRGLSVITWIALIGVVVGVMSLIAVLGVMSGFEKELTSKMLGNHAHITVSLRGTLTGERPSIKAAMARVLNFSDVDSAMPVIYGEAFLLSSGGASEGVMIKGVDPEEVLSVLDLEEYLEEGNWEEFKAGGLILGRSLGNFLRLSSGDSVTLLLNKAEYSPFGVVPKMRRLEVVDLFSSGLSQFDSRTAYLNLTEAEALFERPAQSIEVRAKDVRSINSLRDALILEFGEDARVQDWLSQNAGLLSALRLEKMVMGIILGLIVLVAAFNICGSLIMIVRDKTKDIAIIKSMGGSRQLVLRIFFLQGLFIGGVGTFFGVIFGLIASYILKEWVRFPLDPTVYMIDQVPVDTRGMDIVYVILGAMIISCLATFYPARMASQLEPTKGLKYE